MSLGFASGPDVDEEVELLRKIGEGERSSFDILYERYSDRVMGLCCQVLRNPAEAEEAVQDTFVAVWKYASTYDPGISRPLSWVCMIARRRCLAKLRSSSRMHRRLGTLSEDRAHSMHPVPVGNPAEKAEWRDIGESALRALELLPEVQRLCLRKAWLLGMTHEEIARDAGLPLGTVKTLIRRGLSRLRQLVNKDRL